VPDESSARAIDAARAAQREQSLAGRSAVVSGASRGIGLAVARALAGAGATVAMLARSAERLATEAARLDGRAFAVPCDLTRDDDVAVALRENEARLSDVDVLVSNAGVFPLAAVGVMAPNDFANTIALNLVAPYRLLHHLVPRMRARGTGHVVTIGSVADRTAYRENAAYAAGKYGARGVHEVLREELRGSGVRTSLVSPGPVDTAIWDAIDPDHRDGFPKRAQMLTADDVADAVVWLVTRPPRVNVDELRLTRS
jgi:NADP-dependent 3-hydroxy acid dehydrogenase YdfG